MYDYKVKLYCRNIDEVDRLHSWACENLYGKVNRYVKSVVVISGENYYKTWFSFERHEDKVHFSLKYA